ncbi:MULTISPECIES: site-specific integrase [Vagococcus]|uniref:Integrase n=1 Tax=Vagococcus fluvialis bH819 TaxID=1255619 RepID=A0A1X6WPC4_9ENTE|nr:MULTISPECIES: site-specific integrase [Vagococcus]SLM86183.1 Integrase [Vagococcus fluvialis bH819]HCM89725.1 site-specific integrase [Vagococcus sp.]
MSRRGENIYKRKDGRWEGRYKKGRKDNGKLKYGYVYGKTYKETKIKLNELKYNYQKNNYQKDYYYGTVENWLSLWMLENVENRVKLSTYASYQYKLNRYIIPYIGTKELLDLTTNDIENLIKVLEKKELSASTINVSIGIVKKSLKHAFNNNYIPKDISLNIRSLSNKIKKIRALSMSEQKLLETIANHDEHGLPCLIALYTGLRIGEISGLKWSNIDFEKNIIKVQYTYQRVPIMGLGSKSKLVLSDTKTIGSNRIVPIGKDTKKRLLKWFKIKGHQKFVFEVNGRPVEPRLLGYRFKRMIDNTELKNVHFHQLRHTFATRCLEAQENISVISSILGHQSVKMTLDIYTDALVGQKRIMIHQMEKRQMEYYEKKII